MGTRKNKTRLGEWDFTIQKPMANDVVMRNGLFVAIQDGYIIPADETTPIEGCAINDRYSGENNEHRYCIYQPKRNRESFTMEVENGTLTQEDVGKTFRIIGTDQHINYPTKADFGGQFRLEEVLNDNLGTFTYCFDVQFAPQGPQGNDGQTPTLEVGTVAKLQPDENPTVELVPDPNNPNKYILNMGIPAGATGPRGYQGDKGDTGNPGATGQPGTDGTNGTNGTNGTDGISPYRAGDWNGGETYQRLAMVRYPDTDNTYWTWIRTDEASSGNTPGVDNRWKKMTKDGEPGPQGEAGGTIVVPVEGKPGKDGIGVDGKDGKNGLSPHNEGVWDSNTDYSALAMVRAWTGKYNAFGDEIRGYYITQNGASGTEPYQDTSHWSLVVEDGNGIQSVKDYVDTIEENVVTLGLEHGISVTEKFYDDTSNMDVKPITFDRFTGNRGMVYNAGVIRIKEDGHYQVTGHCILKLNEGSNQYLNIGRYSVALGTSRTGSAQIYMLGTGKSGGPYISANGQGPWLDLSFNIFVDLYAGDTLMPVVRCQSDTTGLKTANVNGSYKIIGGDDTTGSVPGQLDLDSYFATYLGVKMVSHQLFNNGNIRESI